MATLHTSDLTKSYSGRTVVKGVNLDISSGEVVGLLGPNGAGKTTTFSMVVGLTAPDTGRVLLDGAETKSEIARMVVRGTSQPPATALTTALKLRQTC